MRIELALNLLVYTNIRCKEGIASRARRRLCASVETP